MMRIPGSKIVLPITILTALVLGFASCQPRFSREISPITIGIPWLEQHALLFVAAEQGFFAQNDLDVTFKQYDSGPAALDALNQGQVDIAGTSEYPFVHAVLDQHPVQVLASVDHFENNFIMVRKDRGIAQAADLKGKRIGVAHGTIAEFYLGRFLALNGLDPKAVTLVTLKPPQFVKAITSGEVDAIIAWQPYIDQIQKAVPGMLTWPAQGSQQVYGLLVSRSDWLSAHPAIAARFLKSLAQAEEFLNRNPDKARAIVQKRLNYDDAYMTVIWPDHQFALTLDHSMIVAMTDEARWMLKNGQAHQGQIPDFLSTIYLDGLQAVEPGAVEIRP